MEGMMSGQMSTGWLRPSGPLNGANLQCQSSSLSTGLQGPQRMGSFPFSMELFVLFYN